MVLLQTNSSFPFRLSESQGMFNLGQICENSEAQIRKPAYQRPELTVINPVLFPVLRSLIKHAVSANQSARSMETFMIIKPFIITSYLLTSILIKLVAVLSLSYSLYHSVSPLNCFAPFSLHFPLHWSTTIAGHFRFAFETILGSQENKIIFFIKLRFQNIFRPHV